MAGLTAALRLIDRGEVVTVIDAEPEIGGLTRPWEIGPVAWDRFYHVILPGDEATRTLLRRIGIAHELCFTPVKTNFFIGGRLHPFTSARDFATFPELTIADKLRLLGTVAHARFTRDDERYDAQPILEYLTRWSGTRTVERVWHPLLRAKLGEQHAQASAAFIRATIKRLQGARGRDGRERYGFVRGGYATILRALESTLRQAGVEFILGERVRGVTVHGGGAHVALGSREVAGDRAILTLPSPVCAMLCPQLTLAEQRTLTRDRYFGVVCISLLVDRRLGEAYVTNVADPDFEFTGAINMSALAGREQFGGKDLVYVPRYGPREDPVFALTDDLLVARAIDSVQRIFPEMQCRDVVAARVARAAHVFPFPRIGRVNGLPPARTSLRKVTIINTARLRYATLNVSDTIGIVDEAFEELSCDAEWNQARETRCRALA
jgi:protoporphyrinogen oxidase